MLGKFQKWRGVFLEWTPYRVLKLVLIVSFLSFFAFLLLNQRSGPNIELTGVVQHTGMETGSKYGLPAPVLVVALEDKRTVQVAAPPGTAVSKNDRVLLREYRYTFSSGRSYEFIRRLER